MDRHDTNAVHMVAGLLDHLSDEHGAAIRAGDELGVPVGMIELDVVELKAAYASLKDRADGSRKAA